MELYHFSNRIEVVLFSECVPRLFPVHDSLVLSCLVGGGKGRDLHHETQEGIVRGVREEGPELSGFLKVPVTKHPHGIIHLEVLSPKVVWKRRMTSILL